MRKFINAQPQLMASSRSSGSFAGNARVRSAHISMAGRDNRKNHGCVLWLDGASTARPIIHRARSSDSFMLIVTYARRLSHAG